VSRQYQLLPAPRRARSTPSSASPLRVSATRGSCSSTTTA
jgi:hypothetical protein